MPLLGKKSYKPSPFPNDLKSEEEVFVIKETNEVFRSYDEYVNRILLYGFQIWSCQFTGKTNLKYEEAVASEEQALKRLESFPKYFEKTVLQIVHHSTRTLQTLVQECYKQLEKEFSPNEPVECLVNGKWLLGKILQIHHGDKYENSTDKTYDFESGEIHDCLKSIPPEEIRRVKKIPSEELLKCFICVNTQNPWRSDNSPWVVKSDMAKKYSLAEKYNDFSLVLGKKTTPLSKTPSKGHKSNKKQKKEKTSDKNTSQGKSQVKKTGFMQKKLDSFRTSSNGKDITVSLAKMSDKSHKKVTPSKKNFIDICSSPDKDNDKTPSSQLHGTPIKCRLVLTPIKSPQVTAAKSITPERSVVSKDNINMKNMAVGETANDVVITGCKTSQTFFSQPSKKVRSSPKQDKCEKSRDGKGGLNKKSTKKGNISKKLSIVKGTSLKEKRLTYGMESVKKKAKLDVCVPEVESVIVDNDSDKDFQSSSNKIPAKLKQSSGKMRQRTLLDLTKKPEEEKVAFLSSKMTAKKQKTLAEMFSAAFRKEKPDQVINALIRKTAKVVSSPSCLALDLSTPQRDHVTEKWHAHKERLNRKFSSKVNGLLKKCEDSDLIDAKPLPPCKPVNVPMEITAEMFGDIAMIADFVHTFCDLLAPRETLHISIDNLSQALVSGKEGFPLLSRILVVFLQILLQDRSTKGLELGMDLSEMPLTQHTASEISRLYLNAKLKMLPAFEEDKQLQGILESLEQKDFHLFNPEEKAKILVTLCHEVLSSNAVDDYIGSQLTEATELRKQKQAKQREKNDKIREEKERLRKEKQEMEKKKEEEANKKQLKVDELSMKETGTECVTSEPLGCGPEMEISNKMEEKREKQKGEVSLRAEQDRQSYEVVETLRKRREDMAAKDLINEKKLKEKEERLAKEEEEQLNLNMAQCLYSLRLKPIGCDRNHGRYWVFNGVAPGVFVEYGWRNLEDLAIPTKGVSKVEKEVGDTADATIETENKRELCEEGSDIEMVEETKVERKMDSCAKDNEKESRLTDVPYEWSCYSTVEEVQALLSCLSSQGIRESELKKTLKEKLPEITEGIVKRNSSRKVLNPETGEEVPYSSIKEELKDTVERLFYGNLAELENGLEEYLEGVDQAKTVSDLALQLGKLLHAVLPRFYRGMFHLDNKGSEEAKQRWLDAVNKATTVSRCHLLLGILASLVIWDMSAEHARCKICGRKDIGKTLILCDHCNQGYHLHCLRPALSKAPEGDWSCPVCKPNERVSSRTGTKNYKQESGSEIEDSKDEASEASLNSCDENEDYCYTCGEDGDLICCDTCPLVFHKTCHQPPLRNIPRGAWSCWFCRQPKDQKSVKVRKSEKSVKAKGKAKKLLKRMGSFVRESEQKQPHMRIKTASKRIFQKHARDGRKRARDARARAVSRARPSLEDISDEESIDGRGNQKPRRVSRRLQRMYQQVSEDELEENSTRDTNVKSFYGKTNRKVRKREVFSEEDDDLIEERGRNACRKTRAHNRPQISDVSEDEGDDDEDSGKENRKISPFASFQKTTYRSTRNHRKVPSSSEESDESGYTEDSEELNNGRPSRKKGKKNAKNLSVNKAGRKAARKTRRTEESSENSKRRRANVEMDTCEQILRALVRHEDSWPFTQAVNVREVPDYLDLVSTPMDLGTIKGKLNSLEYPDVDSFEADVRLVFSNSDKYNLSTSEVGQAGKNLEQYFDKIFEENFSSKDRKSKIHRKR